MPNFWTQTTQAIYELFNGPRTVDTEFEEKQAELKAAITSMSQITNLITNFQSQTSGLQSFCQNLYTNLPKAYSGNSVYTPFIVDLCNSHKNIENAYLNCCNALKTLQISNQEWDNLFNEVKSALQKREESRKIYDHYDEKMEKLVKERNEKLQKRIEENSKDIEKFERNDGKYKRAANDFIQLSNYCYNKMQELLDLKYKILNPLICTFVNEEKKFFDSCSSFFNKFDNASQKLFGLDQGFKKTPINYDATKHVRAAKLLQGVNIGNLPQIKDKHKYSYNDYQKMKTQPANNQKLNQNYNNLGQSGNANYGVAVNPYNQNQNQNRSQMRSQSLGPSNKGNNNLNYNSYLMNKGNTGNNNTKNTNPFSYQAYLQKNKNVNMGQSINQNNNNNNNNINYNPNFEDLNTGIKVFNFANNNLGNNNFNRNNDSSIQNNPYQSQFQNPYNNNNNNQGNNNY
jgi:hypothetical protein